MFRSRTIAVVAILSGLALSARADEETVGDDVYDLVLAHQ